MFKVMFLDRDGTIVKDYPDDRWEHIKRLELIGETLPYLQTMQANGYKFIFITNQYLIGEGYITQEQFHRAHESLLDELNHYGIVILDTFFCPHARKSNCSCCKPKPGLLQQALSKYPEIELSQSLYLGDSDCDKLAAQSMNINFIRVKKNKFYPFE